MAYTKTTWNNDAPPYINAANLNKLERGVDEAHAHADASHAPTDATNAGAIGDAHAITTHAPTNAQTNSDITKSEVEAVLTGIIATHEHAGGGGSPDFLGLSDTPGSYQAGKLVKVDPAGTALIFGDPSGTSVGWGDVTGLLSHQTDLQNALDAKLENETTTTLNVAGNTLTYVDETGASTNIDLSLYVDDTNLARLTSGTLDNASGIATFTRDDNTTFTVDFSALLGGPPVNVEDVLTSTSTTNALSANQGRILQAEKAPTLHSHNYEPADDGIQSHITSTHAPPDAENNANILKSEVEAVLTGPINTHIHHEVRYGTEATPPANGWEQGSPRTGDIWVQHA